MASRKRAQEPKSVLDQPRFDKSAVVVKLKNDPAAERSLCETLDRELPYVEQPLDRLLQAHADLQGEPVFVQADQSRARNRHVSWVLPTEVWSRSRSTEGVNWIDVPDPSTADEFLRQLKDDPRIAYADFFPVKYPIRSIPRPPNDRLFGKQWGLARCGFPLAWLKVEPAGAVPIPVAVIDTGCNPHVDLERPVTYTAPQNTKPGDRRGHGTCVTGVLAATRNNTSGITGGAVCALHVHQVFRGDTWDKREYIAALKGVATSGVRVVNISLASGDPHPLEDDLLEDCWNNGVVVVAATGNEGSSVPLYPAASPHVIAVGATDRDDARWARSSFGDHIWISAPGVGILTIHPRLKDRYVEEDGTSFAAPLVAAACVLILRRHPDLTPAGVKTLLAKLVHSPGGWNREIGHGRLDIGKLA